MTQFTVKETKVIQAPWWDEDEQVIIRRFGWGDRQELIQAAVTVDLGNVPTNVQINDVQVGAMNLRIMELGIQSWTLKGPGGKIVPVTKKWIYDLSEPTGNFILREINDFNPRRSRSAKEQANFRGAGGDGAAEQQRATSGADASSGDGGDGLELGRDEGDSS